MKCFLVFLCSVSMLAQSQLNVLENFASTGMASGTASRMPTDYPQTLFPDVQPPNFRQNSSDGNVWAVYGGYDGSPDQTYTLDTSSAWCGPGCMKIIGSALDQIPYTVSSITAGNPTIINLAAPNAAMAVIGQQVVFATLSGTGCGALPLTSDLTSGTRAEVSAVTNASTFSINVNSTGCSFASGTIRGSCVPWGCGIYWNFFPHPYVNPTPGLGFVKDYLKTGTWDAANNRVYYRYMCNKDVPSGGIDSPTIQIGYYSKDPTDQGSGTQGNHYYSSNDSYVHANRWIHQMLDNQPTHEVSQVGAMRPTLNEMLAYSNSLMWNGETRFYTQTGKDAVNPRDKWANATCWLTDFRAGLIAGEPDSWVSSTAATYSGPIDGFATGRYELYFNSPPNTAVTYAVKYSTTGSMHTNGFSTGTQMCSNPASTNNDNTGVYCNSANIAEAPNLWIAVRPTMQLLNCMTRSGAIACQPGGSSSYGMLSQSNLSTGDEVTVASVGGCTAANGTWTTTIVPNKIFSIGGGQLTDIVVSSNVATATTTSSHGLIVGQLVQINRPDGISESPSTVGPVLSTPTGTTFTFAWTQANGTYNAATDGGYGAILTMHASEFVSLDGSSSCNSAYTSGGTLVATSDTTNFKEMEVNQVGASTGGSALTGKITIGGKGIIK